ncbi:glycosyl hydrolase family 18 protein, partial [Flavobacteriaceae bacterium]|nr:glycosyl hydrolase family 18 protein [Flavobacteriaceae bacterium]
GGDHLNDPLNRNVDDKGIPIPDSTKENQVLDGLVRLYIDKLGAVKDKLIMGVPFYGKIFELADADEREFAQLQRDDPDNKFPAIIPITRNDDNSPLPGLYQYAPREQPTYDDGIKNTDKCTGIIRQPPIGSYDDLDYKCEKSGVIEFNDLFIGFKGKAAQAHQYLDLTDPTKVSQTAGNAGWKRYWDETAKVPYLFNEQTDEFISYDDPQSIDLKVKYALSKGLGGVMIWELSQDARDSDLGLLDVIDESLLEADYNITLNFIDASSDSGAPLGGVDVQLKDADGELLDSSTSDVNGQVVFSDKKAYLEYKITYTKDALSFLPSDVVFEALEFENDTTININGSSSVVSISGTIQENSTPITDVRVVLKNTADGEELKEFTSTDGNFELDGLISGLDYTLIAEKDYYSFTSLTYTNISTDQTNQMIEGTRNAHTINGNIVSDSSPIEGVTVTVSGNGQDYTDNTDSNGDYTIANIPAGYNYTVTPTKSDVNFLPTNAQVNLLNEDKTLNFSENRGLIYGTVKNGTTPVAGADVHLILLYEDGSHTYNPDNHAFTNADGEYFFEETIFDGYTQFNLTLNPWQNNSTTYFPALVGTPGTPVPSTPQEINFNSQPVTPQVTITTPSQSNVSINYGDSVSLEALVDLTYDDGSTTLSSVIFDIDGTTISNSNTDSNYTATWLPTDSDFGTSHTFTVTAESSNGESATKTFDFTLECTGTNCPNVLPQLALVTPTNTTINQNNGFEIIPITVTATDSDGTVSNVSITIDESTSNMTAGADNTYTYNFLPSKHQEYPIVITAVDDESGSKTLNETLNIIDSQFVPLPDKVNVGYIHSWNADYAPYIYLKDVPTTFNVVVYAFIETKKIEVTPNVFEGDGFTPVLTIYDK